MLVNIQKYAGYLNYLSNQKTFIQMLLHFLLERSFLLFLSTSIKIIDEDKQYTSKPSK